MKKWLTIFLIFFLILIVFLYVFIPYNILINRNLSINANTQGLFRNLADNKNWEKWWPVTGDFSSTNKPEQKFFFNGYTYRMTDQSINSLFISISDKKDSVKTLLRVIPQNNDSVKLIWEGEILTSNNPINRIKKYFIAKSLNKDIAKIMENLKVFFSNNKNIYGVQIKQELVVDSLLISTYKASNGYPTTSFIYALVDQLKNYIISQSAKETGYPMLNVSTSDSISFITKVAIPVNKKLKDSGMITYKWMLGGGKILVTEIIGGYHSLDKGFSEVEQYITDYNRVTPAIPFQSLVTDRTKEYDTSKWITRIFYPVM